MRITTNEKDSHFGEHKSVLQKTFHQLKFNVISLVLLHSGVGFKL